MEDCKGYSWYTNYLSSNKPKESFYDKYSIKDSKKLNEEEYSSLHSKFNRKRVKIFAELHKTTFVSSVGEYVNSFEEMLKKYRI